MRAITVRQPWAWAIIHGGKDVENRSRNIAGTYRGPVAIHAGVRVDPAALPPAGKVGAGMWWNDAPKIRGAIIGVVDLVGVHTSAECFRVDPQDEAAYLPCSPWAQYRLGQWPPSGGPYRHLVLKNPRPLTHPIPWRGRLGLWIVPADLEAAIREQVTS